MNDKSRDDLIYQHFHGPAHSGIKDLHIQLIDRDEKDLLDREGQWAYRLKSVKPHGLNESDFFFSQLFSKSQMSHATQRKAVEREIKLIIF